VPTIFLLINWTLLHVGLTEMLMINDFSREKENQNLE